MVEEDWDREERSSSAWLILLAGLAFLLALGSLSWLYLLQNRLQRAESRLRQAEEQNLQLTSEQAALRRELRATTEAFGAKVGITQRQIELQAEEILHRQQAATTRMAEQEAATRRQVGAVSNAVSSVQSDVGGVRQDVDRTERELTSTEQQLHAAIGDLGIQSGLIAKNAEQLDALKHLGDRSYFSFTLLRGKPAVVSTVKLELRKADTKHSRYTLEISSDDKRIEKKNRDQDEPLQFLSGNPPMLFEVVINQIGKNQVSGYLAAPKGTPRRPDIP